MALNTLKEHIEQSDSKLPKTISESNLLSKGYAISQLARFKSEFQRLKSQRSKVKNVLDRVRSKDEVSPKIDLLASALEEMSTLIALDAALKQHVMNAIVADNLLSADLKRLLMKKR